LEDSAFRVDAERPDADRGYSMTGGDPIPDRNGILRSSRIAMRGSWLVVRPSETTRKAWLDPSGACDAAGYRL